MLAAWEAIVIQFSILLLYTSLNPNSLQNALCSFVFFSIRCR